MNIIIDHEWRVNCSFICKAKGEKGDVVITFK